MVSATTPERSTRGRRALVTGVTGQDGSYLAELLLAKGYDVHGLVHRDRPPAAGPTHAPGLAVDPRVTLHVADLNDGPALVRVVAEAAPDELYNLGAMSNVRSSFDLPAYTAATNGGGTVRLLDAIRAAGLDCRFFQASSSELFGAASPPPQSETSTFHPRSPYGAAKLFSHWVTVNAREMHGMYAVSAIMFNHESPRRGPAFVTRKITRAAARISAGLDREVHLGNLDAIRDWGYAPEYVEAIWLMLQQDSPTDFVLATGVGHTVEQFCAAAFGHVGLDWRDHVHVDPAFVRPPETYPLIGDPGKAQDLLGWKAQTLAGDVARIMVEADLALVRDEP